MFVPVFFYISVAWRLCRSFDESVFPKNRKTSPKKRSLLCLYAVSTCQGVLKDTDFRCCESEHNKEQSDHAEQRDCPFRRLATCIIGVKEPCFVKIRNGGGNKENCDVDPIGRPSDHTVVGVEDDRNEGQTQKNSA